jgi:uncharacterized protein (UPF0264 family)
LEKNTLKLLVSVRNVLEAAAALEGGADVIDVKEPAHGPLGRADQQTIAQIVRLVGRRRPVIAALGEWTDPPAPIPQCNLTFIKWGLAGWRGRDWRQSLDFRLSAFGSRLSAFDSRAPVADGRWPMAGSRCRPVVVAYADWKHADAPPVEEIAAAARHWRCGLLVDTFRKKPGSTLLDWLSIPQIQDLCCQCRQADVPIALAGSLGAKEIAALSKARPDWFGVRGGVCEKGRRDGAIQAGRVQKLATLVRNLNKQQAPQRVFELWG